MLPVCPYHCLDIGRRAIGGGHHMTTRTAHCADATCLLSQSTNKERCSASRSATQLTHCRCCLQGNEHATHGFSSKMVLVYSSIPVFLGMSCIVTTARAAILSSWLGLQGLQICASCMFCCMILVLLNYKQIATQSHTVQWSSNAQLGTLSVDEGS